jgi:DNA modification methylase
MEAFYEDDTVQLYLGDSLDILPTLADASVDAVVCDPPYALTELPTGLVTDALTAWLTGDRAYIPAAGVGFMGRDWDRFVPPPAIWDECLRVLKPGGHLLTFASARTVDLMGISIRLARLEIRDSIDWIHGNGMPKGKHQLKPAHEPIIVARKPLAGTIAATIHAHGTGGLNIDGCRTTSLGAEPNARLDKGSGLGYGGGDADRGSWDGALGRWPTNILLSHGPNCVDGGDCLPGCPVAEMDAQSGMRKAGERPAQRAGIGYSGAGAGTEGKRMVLDSGGASRFFPVFRYEAKAPKAERPRLADGTAWPTVKPLALMRWLVRLVTPPGGTVLDWCAGTGTTLEAARLEGIPAIGVEREKQAAELCRVRLAKPYMTDLFSGGAA